MGLLITTTVTLAAAVANGYALSQTPGAAGNLVLNGSLVTAGVGIPPAPARVGITSADNDSGRKFTITGTARPEQGGAVISETVTGANAGTVLTTQDFASITQIATDGATAGAVTSGTGLMASGPWVPWSEYAPDFEVSCAGTLVSGAPTWQVDYTYDNVLQPGILAGTPYYPTVFVHGNLQGMVASGDGFLTGPVRASRLTLVAAGTVRLVQTQQGS